MSESTPASDEAPLKDLPLDVQSFRNIVESRIVYVDKTGYLAKIASKGKAYFLSRPRRFGKSLIVSTLKELFLGNEELFDGLDITRTNPKFVFKKHPVLHFDMFFFDRKSPELLEKTIIDQLGVIAKREGLEMLDSSLALTLKTLVEDLAGKYKEKVVVLIDEYDSPVSETLGMPGQPGQLKTLAEANTEVLKSFYGAFKGLDEHLRFVFVTGVTRYAFMGLSAGFNQLQDLSLDRRYSAICGFTVEEVERYFGDRFETTIEMLRDMKRLPPKSDSKRLMDELVAMYDGYSWDGVARVFNPVSVVKFFDKAIFDNYWRSTSAVPSSRVLAEAMAGDPLALTADKLRGLNTLELGSAEIGSLKPIPALFQTGYLTVESVSYEKTPLFTLRVPNEEIRDFLFPELSANLFKNMSGRVAAEAEDFPKALADRDGEKLSELMTRACHSLAATIHSRYPDMLFNEAFYNGMFFMYCYRKAEQISSEPPGAYGTPDMSILFPGGLRAVVEIKYGKDPVDEAEEAQKRDEDEAGQRGGREADGTGLTADVPPEAKKKRVTKPKSRTKLEKERSALLEKLAGNAIEQILKKSYHVPYGSRGEKVVLVGIGICGRGWCRFRLEDPPPLNVASPAS